MREDKGTLMRFERGEAYLIALITAAALVSAALAAVKGVSVEVGALGFPIAFNFLFLAIGQFYRLKRPDPRIAAVATSIGLIMIFGTCLPTAELFASALSFSRSRRASGAR